MMRSRNLPFSSLLLLCFAVNGCMHSHVIQVTVSNTSTEKITNIVIDYPEATFGINSLEPGKSFQYKIKATGTGPIKISFLNSHAQDRVSTGPVVHKDDEGSIDIKVTQDGAVAEVKLSSS